MSGSDFVYVASGFYDDCIKLLELFKNNESYEFQEFCKAWQEMKFSLVFLGRKSYGEMLEFCEEAINIAKNILISSTELIDKVGGLYLLYGLFYKCPIENTKIRVTKKEWLNFLNFHDKIKREEFYDASYIFVKLVMDNAFYHCLFENEYGIEKNLQSNLEIKENPHSILPELIEQVENGEFSELQKLSKLYDEQKAKLINTSTNKLQLFDKNVVDKIIKEIECVEEKKNILMGLRKKYKDINFRGKEDKLKFNTENKIRPKLGHAFDTDSSDDENLKMKFDFANTPKYHLPSTLNGEEGNKDNELNNENSDNINENDGIEYYEIS